MPPEDDPARTVEPTPAAISSIVEIWRAIMKRDDIDPDSHLLDLGATSLTAVRIRSRIRSELGKDVDLLDIVDHPTPRALAPVVAVAPAWAGHAAWHGLDGSAPDAGPGSGPA